MKQGGKREQHAGAGNAFHRFELRLRLDELARARQSAIQLALGRHARSTSLIRRRTIPRALDGTLDGVAVHDMGALEERGEVERLRFEPDAVTLTWDERGLVVSYNLYRGDLAVLRAGGDYTQDPATVDNAERWCQLTSAQQSDTETPPAGSGFVYLVSPVGAAEGSLGFDGSNTERPNAAPCF